MQLVRILLVGAVDTVLGLVCIYAAQWICAVLRDNPAVPMARLLLPVVAPKWAANREFVEDGVTGILADEPTLAAR
jgi:hypothetical protein